MSTTVLVLAPPGSWVATRPRIRDRFAARMWARKLDRALASGASPEANVLLALRARRLTEPGRRCVLASSLRQIARDGLPRRIARDALPRRRDRALGNGAFGAAAEPLGMLADALDRPGPITAQGAAQAWLLLTDGTGPLYNPRAGVSLRESAARAARVLRPPVALY